MYSLRQSSIFLKASVLIVAAVILTSAIVPVSAHAQDSTDQTTTSADGTGVQGNGPGDLTTGGGPNTVNPDPTTGNCPAGYSKQDKTAATGISGVLQSGANAVGININATCVKTGPPSTPTSCSGLGNYITGLAVCIFRTIVTGIGGLLVTISSWILLLAGLLFDWIVNKTILQFSTLYTGAVQTSVETGWGVFRDVGNILIIGMFVFIAISLILGLEQFGKKRMIANVLIIAVLINFSLLFTKLIVDFSNFTALQFYTASMGAPPGAPDGLNIGGSSQNGATANSSTGFAGRFLSAMKITGIGDSFGSIWKLAEQSDSGWIALAHGILTAVVFGLAAFVLLYGSFLLATRAVLIIFLLLTSALAFASYLIPKFTSNGWDMWWKSLLRCATLAPLLMLFLAITLGISTALTGVAGTLGGLVGSGTGSTATAPTGASIGTLFNYVIILGLLFASFKISSSFAKSISGFGFSGSLLASPLTLGAQFLGAPLARRFIGGGAYGRATALEKEIEEDKRKPKSQRQSAAWFIQKQEELAKMKTRAASTFNPFNASIAKTVSGGLGIEKWASGQSKAKGYSEQVKENAKDVAEKYGAMALTNKDTKEIVDRAVRAAEVGPRVTQTRIQKEQLEEQRRNNKEEYDRRKKEFEENKARDEKDIAGAQAHRKQELEEIKEALVADTAGQAADPGNTERQERINSNKERQDAIMRERDDLIEHVKREVNQRQASLAKPLDVLKDSINKLDLQIAAVQKSEPIILKEEKDKAKVEAAETVKSYSDTMKEALSMRKSWNPLVNAADVNKEVLKKWGDKEKEESIKSLIASMGSEAPATPAAAPATPATDSTPTADH